MKIDLFSGSDHAKPSIFGAICRKLRICAAAFLTVSFVSCRERNLETPTPSIGKNSGISAELNPAIGKALAAKWCVNCHLLPSPTDLSRERWPFVVKWMGNYLGHLNNDEDIKNLIYPTLVATQESLTRDELNAIETYYMSEAPEQIAPAFPRNGVLPMTPLFQPSAWPEYTKPETISLVAIDSQRQQVYVGSVSDSLLRLFTSDGKLLNKINCSENQAVVVRPTVEGFDLVLMGDIGRDVEQGTVHRILGAGTTLGPLRATRLVTGFHRTSGAAWGDLDGDGSEDIVLAGFGDYAFGALAWFAVKPGEEAVRHDMRLGSGTLDAIIDDVDHDGDLDVLAIVAQGHQEMLWFENVGSGQFQSRLLWKERSAMGYNAFQWVDFDRDGDRDIVAVSGNNMEMPDPPLKALHGIYVYLQTSPMQFTKTHFLRMDGATKAIAADFDSDGDTDIAAIAAYPDWRARQPVTFILFNNAGESRFQPTTIASEFSGQSITMAAGDLEGDGDVDLLVGNANWPPLLPEPLLTQINMQIKRVPPVVLLRNNVDSATPEDTATPESSE